jgi:hypothetical protein
MSDWDEEEFQNFISMAREEILLPDKYLASYLRKEINTTSRYFIGHNSIDRWMKGERFPHQGADRIVEEIGKVEDFEKNILIEYFGDILTRFKAILFRYRTENDKRNFPYMIEYGKFQNLKDFGYDEEKQIILYTKMDGESRRTHLDFQIYGIRSLSKIAFQQANKKQKQRLLAKFPENHF